MHEICPSPLRPVWWSALDVATEARIRRQATAPRPLAAYDAGSGTVHYAINVGGANWYNYLPVESQNYVTIIMG